MSSREIETRLNEAPIVPLVQSEDPQIAVRTTHALINGGLTVVEVVLRTEAALECLAATRTACSDAIIGAGTVLTAQQAEAAIEAGAQFVVSPGLVDSVVEIAQKHDLPVYPGVATASEAQRAWNLGLDAVKFFPAGISGGTAMLKALGSVFRQMKFMPTGGVSAGNLGEYLSVPSVFACGGSWLTPACAISTGDFETVTNLAREAIAIAQTSRGN